MTSIIHKNVDTGKTYPDENMKISNKNVEDRKFEHCKDFLCPPESQIQEWFPTELECRIRAQALDPYGFMHERNQGRKDKLLISFKCQDENCHARLLMRKVDPDPDGNVYGLFGCNSHQHPLSRKNKSEIIFNTRLEAYEFFDKNLKTTYRTQATGTKERDYKVFWCRRKMLKHGHHPCESIFTLKESFGLSYNSIPKDKKPFSIAGIFYHSHKNEEKYNRDEFGGYSIDGRRVTKPRKNKNRHPRIKNNMVYPLKCRGKFTVEEVLEAQKKGYSLTY